MKKDYLQDIQDIFQGVGFCEIVQDRQSLSELSLIDPVHSSWVGFYLQSEIQMEGITTYLRDGSVFLIRRFSNGTYLILHHVETNHTLLLNHLESLFREIDRPALQEAQENN